jgi:hypothetical protein
VYLCENSRSWWRTPGWTSWTDGAEERRRAIALAVEGRLSAGRDIFLRKEVVEPMRTCDLVTDKAFI